MDRLWSPWRNEYIASAGSADSEARACVFCDIQSDSAKDEQNFVVHRARRNFIVLNLHPYITGHLLIVPYEHIGELDASPKDTTDEMMDLTKQAQTTLREVYKPSGFNVGMNLGAVAGAGIADHIHLHIMPRWSADTNFMSTIANTRVLPEDLTTTFNKLRGRF